ncbi:acyl carrier protein [Streptomyces flavofungini]|uniref:acyl carrier protein n=1 Tax=Streptomyces flavofungini TaxID=68200 RepID=UPI0025AFE7CB|nr:phosphopantetheine-binding protein [Streptomyces flavofungini]WJV44755.1 phosphopantetheine-binding protein [Streptomyces flavofungini]
MDRTEALSVVTESIVEIVPGADLTTVAPDESLRDALELDSIDFLSLVETLSERADVRIDEEDYPELGTLDGAVGLLVART